MSNVPLHGIAKSVFPHGKLREGQEEALGGICDFLERGTGLLLVDSPPGSGKTDVVLAALKALDCERIFWIVPTRSLQSQVSNSLQRYLQNDLSFLNFATPKGQEQYGCDCSKRPNCSRKPHRLLRPVSGAIRGRWCWFLPPASGCCPYWKERLHAMTAKVTVMTYHYLLHDAMSSKAQGLLQPIMVRPLSEDSWELIFGNHRLQSCRRLGWKTMPCRVCEIDDAKAFMTAEVENLQKNNFIDPVQEARGFKMLREEKSLTESEIGKSIGKTQQYVSSRSGLLRLEPEIQALITSRLVSAEHGHELSKIEDAKKRTILAELSRKDREDSLNLNELREMAKLTIEELSKDARVDTILLQDPAERIRRIEARVMKLENDEAHLFEADKGLEHRTYLLTANSTWKRDHCDHYKGDICEHWLWNQNVAAWKMKRDGGGWRLRVSLNSEFCATCPAYKEKASQPTK